MKRNSMKAVVSKTEKNEKDKARKIISISPFRNHMHYLEKRSKLNMRLDEKTNRLLQFGMLQDLHQVYQ